MTIGGRPAPRGWSDVMPSEPKPRKRRGRKPKKRNPEDSCLVTVRIKGDDYNRLIEWAEADGVSLEQFVRNKVFNSET